MSVSVYTNREIWYTACVSVFMRKTVVRLLLQYAVR